MHLAGVPPLADVGAPPTGGPLSSGEPTSAKGGTRQIAYHSNVSDSAAQAVGKVWRAALDRYSYPVNLREYQFRAEHPGWFERTTGSGSRDATIAFEDQFRREASYALEAWFEVVFWKLANYPQIRNGTTHAVVTYLSRHATASELWDRCCEYMESPTAPEARARFEVLLRIFGMKTPSIAVVATFPAFIDPGRFAMIDTRIAKWVGMAMQKHNSGDPSGAQLARPRFLNSKQTVLQMNDFEFMLSWVRWCRYTSGKLSRLTVGFEWRPRDVEMAVFQAWGKSKQHPEIFLPPCPPI